MYTCMVPCDGLDVNQDVYLHCTQGSRDKLWSHCDPDKGLLSVSKFSCKQWYGEAFCKERITLFNNRLIFMEGVSSIIALYAVLGSALGKYNDKEISKE